MAVGRTQEALLLSSWTSSVQIAVSDKDASWFSYVPPYKCRCGKSPQNRQQYLSNLIIFYLSVLKKLTICFLCLSWRVSLLFASHSSLSIRRFTAQSPRRHEFDHKPVDIRLVEGRLALQQSSVIALQCPSVSISLIPLIFQLYTTTQQCS